MGMCLHSLPASYSIYTEWFGLVANVVKEIDHTHEQEMLKYVIYVYKALSQYFAQLMIPRAIIIAKSNKNSYYLTLSCCFLATFGEMLLSSSGNCEW